MLYMSKKLVTLCKFRFWARFAYLVIMFGDLNAGLKTVRFARWFYCRIQHKKINVTHLSNFFAYFIQIGKLKVIIEVFVIIDPWRGQWLVENVERKQFIHFAQVPSYY